MFKLHKPHLASPSNIIHSGHFMVSRYDDDEDDQNDAGDDSSESERDNGQNYEIDVSNPDAVADATKSLDISYQVQSPSAKNELVTSWNDLDRPPAKRPHQYLTYYTNKSSSGASGQSGQKPNGAVANDDLGGQRRKVLATGSGCSTSSTTIVSVVNSSDDPDEQSSMPVDATIEGRISIMRLSTLANSNNTTTTTRTATATTETTTAASQLVSTTSSLHLVASAASAVASNERAASTSTMITPIDAYYDDDGNNEPHDLRGGDPAGSQQRHQTIVLQGQLQNNLQVQQVYHQNPDSQKHALTIDASLTKLLESMSLYYSSKLTSPKWKSFKGLKLRMKHKIRLNNLIWRAWFLQCIRGREPPGCQFTAPAETDVHKKSETIVLEGKYWKRKEKAIVDEYKKWRIFHKQKSQIAMCQMHCFRPSSFDWDTRVSNWASSSSMYGAELSLYPDEYDANLSYNLDELNPMPSQLEPDAYYQPNPISQAPNMGTRMIEAPQQQQQQQQTMSATTTIQTIPQQSAQFITQPQVPSRLQENPTNHNQVQNQAHLQQQPSQHQLHHQALSLKADRLTPMQQYSPDQMHQLGPPQAISISLPNFAHHHHHHQHHLQQQQQPQNHLQQQQQQHSQQQHSNFHQQQLQHQQMQHNSHLQQQQLQHQHQHQQQHQQLVPFSFENNAVYQQIQQQQQQQQQQPHQLNQAQQQMQQHQLQDQPDSYSNHQDFCSVSSGGSGSSIMSGMEGGRNEQRRVCHINAEQKRRCNIKNGFDTLKSILPSVSPNTNVKVSKASMLQKAAIYISSLTAEQKQQLDEQAILRQQVDSLKQAILAQQAQLPPVNGVLLGPQASSASTIRAREMFQDYVRKRTIENWKFWVFSILIEPLYESYHRAVSANNLEDAFKTIYGWLDQSAGLNSLRKDATESFTVLSTSTNVLTSPQTLPTEAVQAVRYPNNLQQQPQQHSTSSSSSSSTTTTTIASANRSMQILPDLTGTSQTCYTEATF